MNNCRSAGCASSFTQESTLPLVALHAVNLSAPYQGELHRNYNARKASAGTNIKPTDDPRTDQVDLCAIGDMANPQRNETAFRNQIVFCSPTSQQFNKHVEPLRCFTW